MPTLTIGTNTYQALADADAYFADVLETAAWDAATDTDKAKALVAAFRALESIPQYAGVPYASAQTTAWPRAYVYDGNGNAYASGDGTEASHYPAPLQHAQCDEALELLKRAQSSSYAATERDRQQGISERRTSEGASVKYDGGSPVRYGGALTSERAYTLIRPLLSTGPARVSASNGPVDLRYVGGRYRGEGEAL